MGVCEGFSHHAGEDAPVRLVEQLEYGNRSTDPTAKWRGHQFALLSDVGDDGYVEGILERLREGQD